MNREQVHDLMENELRCVQRGNYCDRECAKCPLVKDDKELIEAYGYVIKELKQLREPTRWTPISEKLPEIQNYSDNYFVTLKRGGVHIAMFTKCDGKSWWTYDDVIAWMPLPEPYKAESEE